MKHLTLTAANADANKRQVTELLAVIANATTRSDGLEPGRLHNLLYALAKGPMLPRNDHTDSVTFSNGEEGTLADLDILRHNGFLSSDVSGGARLSELGKSVLSVMNATHGLSKWQQDAQPSPLIA